MEARLTIGNHEETPQATTHITQATAFFLLERKFTVLLPPGYSDWWVGGRRGRGLEGAGWCGWMWGESPQLSKDETRVHGTDTDLDTRIPRVFLLPGV